MNQELYHFVKNSIDRGIEKKSIETVLKKAGWSPDDVKNAFDRFYLTDYPIAIPKRSPYLNAREAFLLLIVFTTLYISAINFGILIFQYINYWFFDPISFPEGDFSTITVRSALASLIIAFPIFLLVSRAVEQSFAAILEKKESKIYKWLTYITLFVTTIVMIVDLIMLMNNLLAGELTWRFSLKVLTVLIIAGTVFTYYLLDLRRGEKGMKDSQSKTPFRFFLALLIAAVVTVVTGGIFLSGKPSSQRDILLDDQRVSHLQSISFAIDRYWENHDKKLPADFESLGNERDIYVNSFSDPQTNATYEYSQTDETSYRLCATFARASEDTSLQTKPRALAPSTFENRFWDHPSGYHCYDFTARPSIK
ncbi:MAG: hypothetical protein HY453_00630 [Parcubacteria group bacterium]|nr:hypothetical protein [Parcubacteria group bacterium]